MVVGVVGDDGVMCVAVGVGVLCLVAFVADVVSSVVVVVVVFVVVLVVVVVVFFVVFFWCVFARV